MTGIGQHFVIDAIARYADLPGCDLRPDPGQPRAGSAQRGLRRVYVSAGQ